MTETGDGRTGSAALERLRRWETAGGTWHVLSIGAAGGRVLLERCDVGEAVDVLASDDPDFVAHLRHHQEGDG